MNKTKQQYAINAEPLKLLFPIDLQFFAADPDPTPDPDPNPDPNDPEKKFSQEDVNRVVKERVARAEKKAAEKLAKELGFDSVEEMKAKFNPNKDPQPTPDVDALIEEKLKAERQATFKRLVTAEVKLLASDLGFADWEDALALANLSEVKEDENGNITGVKEALEELAKKKPHLLKQQKAKGGFGAEIPNNKQQQSKSKEELIKMAQNRGIVTQAPNDPWAKK